MADERAETEMGATEPAALDETLEVLIFTQRRILGLTDDQKFAEQAQALAVSGNAGLLPADKIDLGRLMRAHHLHNELRARFPDLAIPPSRSPRKKSHSMVR